jgi:hypothetical protein
VREGEISEPLAEVPDVRSPAPSKHGGDPYRSAGTRKPRETGLTTGPRSAGFDDGGIAVRAHRHLPKCMRDSHPRHIRPQRPKRLDRTATGEPGPLQLALAGGARTQSGTGPNGDRALERGGVGEKRMHEAWQAPRATIGHGGNAGNSMAGTGMALSVADGRCRCGPSGAHGRGPRAFGSGHCLQSRISHDSFLVGYDWWIELWVLR